MHIYSLFILLQVYDGPTSKRLDSRPRFYATGYPEPKSGGTSDEAIGMPISYMSTECV